MIVLKLNRLNSKDKVLKALKAIYPLTNDKAKNSRMITDVSTVTVNLWKHVRLLPDSLGK